MTEPATMTVIGFKSALLVSALSGGAVATLRARGPWWVRLAAGISGATVSYFLTPIVAPLAEIALEQMIQTFWHVALDLDSPSVLGAAGFLLGATGMESVQIVADLMRGQVPLSTSYNRKT